MLHYCSCYLGHSVKPVIWAEEDIQYAGRRVDPGILPYALDTIGEKKAFATADGKPDNGPPCCNCNGDGRVGYGLEAILNFSISASLSLFSLARLFWNQILTWVSVRLREDENSARSAIDRYCLERNLRSRDRSCWVVKGVLGLRLLLCLLRWQVRGVGFGDAPSEPEKKMNFLGFVYTFWKIFLNIWRKLLIE